MKSSFITKGFPLVGIFLILISFFTLNTFMNDSEIIFVTSISLFGVTFVFLGTILLFKEAKKIIQIPQDILNKKQLKLMERVKEINVKDKNTISKNIETIIDKLNRLSELKANLNIYRLVYICNFAFLLTSLSHLFPSHETIIVLRYLFFWVGIISLVLSIFAIITIVNIKNID